MGKKRTSLASVLTARFKELDQFGHEFKMNLRGDSSINSVYGAFISVILLFVLLYYSAIRLEVLQAKRDTIRSAITVQDHINEEISFDFKKNDFQLAFAVENYQDRSAKDDPDYVEWQVSVKETIGGIETARSLSWHPCTKEDYASFYEPSRKAVGILQRLKDRGSLRCLDPDQDISIRGEDDNTDS
jgi:hypothetical protein